MLISNKYKFVIINIPKTGTKSHRETLREYIDHIGLPRPNDKDFYQHETIISAKKKFIDRSWDWSMYFKYTIVRNPWSRFASLYFWANNTYTNNLNKDLDTLPKALKLNFLGLQKMFSQLNHNPKKIFKHMIKTTNKQEDFLCINKTIAVDHIARFENISQEFNFLCNTIGITPTPKLKHENKNPSYNYKDLYNQELIDLVAEKEKFVIEKYNYEY